MKHSTHCRPGGHQGGFSLIELMIGMAIALIVTVVIAQVLIASESRRRTTVSGSDAQVGGALAMFALQRDIEMAGFGLGSEPAARGCTVKSSDAAGNPSQLSVLAPVLITDGAAGAPDTITLQSSGSRSPAIAVRVIKAHGATDTTFDVATTVGIKVNDVLVAVPPAFSASAWCTMFSATAVPTVTKVEHNAMATAPWNQAGMMPTGGYPVGSFVVNLGNPQVRTYSIDANQRLQTVDYDAANNTNLPAEVVNGDIVNLQAYYAKDTNGDGQVDTYDTTLPSTNVDWNQVRGIRLAVVARSAQREKEDVTFADPNWDVGTAGTFSGAVTCGTSKCITLIVNTLGTDWKQYRYKVYDAYIPLRNLLWRAT